MNLPMKSMDLYNWFFRVESRGLPNLLWHHLKARLKPIIMKWSV